MDLKPECPKCASQAYYQRTEYDLILRCLCGYHKVVATTLETICIEHNDTGVQVKLPKKGSNLYITLSVLAVNVQLTSAELTCELNLRGLSFTVSDVASHLTILRSKGLVTTLENRRGRPGGSTWAATDTCRELLGFD